MEEQEEMPEKKWKTSENQEVKQAHRESKIEVPLHEDRQESTKEVTSTTTERLPPLVTQSPRWRRRSNSCCNSPILKPVLEVITFCRLFYSQQKSSITPAYCFVRSRRRCSRYLRKTASQVRRRQELQAIVVIRRVLFKFSTVYDHQYTAFNSASVVENVIVVVVTP